MSKRPAEEHENGGEPLKAGERPEKAAAGDGVGEFEDEFEDEYESEDEVLEAGVDGRLDAEREAEEKSSTYFHASRELPAHYYSQVANSLQIRWKSSSRRS